MYLDKDILVVSRDKQLRERVADTLCTSKYNVLTGSVVDGRLGAGSGLVLAECEANDVLRYHYPLALREGRTVAVSSTKIEKDVVSILMGGATGFINIDESNRLLAARIEAAFAVHNATNQQVFSAPPFRFDYIKRQVFKNDRSLGLSPKEFQFAEYVFSRPCCLLKAPDIMAWVWSAPFSVDSRSIDTVAYQVRKKMELGTANAGWDIMRVRSVGFRVIPL